MNTNWAQVTLNDVCKTQYGYTASAEDSAVGPKYLRITDIMKPQIDWQSVPYCRIDEEKINKYRLKQGDIVIARTGYPGHAKLIRHDLDAVFASYLVRVTLDESIANPQYVGRLLESPIYRRFIESVKSGAAQANANSKILTLFRFPLPPLNIQSRIAEVLSNYDNLIENNQRKIQLLEQAARLLYKEWFVHLRFPGHEHTTITDGVPEGWKRKTIGESFRTTLGGTPSRKKPEYWNGDVPWINSSEVNKTRILSATEFITEEGLSKSAAKLMSAGTTVVAITGATLGQVSRLEIECSANQSVIGIYDEENLRNEWLYLFFVHEIKKIINYATGGAQQHINKEIVNATEYLEPPSRLLNAFREEVSSIFCQIRNLELQNASLSRAHGLLLPKLMTGELLV